MKLLVASIFSFLFCTVSRAQSCIPTNINNAVFNFSCGINCDTVSLQVPNLKASSDYILNTIPFTPFPFTSPTGIELPVLYADDEYSAIIPLPFGFCFYDSLFSKVVVGSNGLITFDTTNALCANAWTINPLIPYALGTQCSSVSTYYPKASIMAAFSDLDPRLIASPPDRKIEWRIEGSAPCRKLIVNFYKIGVFGNNACGLNTPNVFQIVIYESSGLIDLYFERKACYSSTNAGKAILGIQDWTRTKAVAGVGKNATLWNLQNEAYRFTPNSGATRFVKAELFNLSNTFIAIADTATTMQGLLDISFPNVCPTGTTQQFIVKTTYLGCPGPDIPVFLVSLDTITINKTNSLNATAVATNINCLSGEGGTIIYNVPVGSGVPPYQFSLNGGTLQSGNYFSGLAAGTYTVFATDPNGCSSTQNVAITLTGNIGVSVNSIPTSCAGINNGVITISPSGGMSPFQYSLNGGAPQSSNIFSNLSPGSYSILVTDALGCGGNQVANVLQGAGITAIFTTTATACAGINNGSITATPASGSAPFQYSLNSGAWQSSANFPGLAAGLYTISVKDANNCISNFSVNVPVGAPLNATIVLTDVSCFGGTNGSINVTVTNGTGPFQYSLNNIVWQASNVFTNLIAGTYTVYFKDNNPCSNSLTVSVLQPSVLSATTVLQPVVCNGQNNGVITITALGGTAPYLYSLNGTLYQASNIFNVSAGSFTVYVKDSKNCIQTQVVNVSQPNALNVSSNISNASCDGGNDGVITVTGNGGNGGFQYSIDGTNFQLSNVFNVAPGSYTISVKDIKNCIATQNVTVGLNNNLTLTPAADKILCEGSSVQLNVSTNATQFLWTPSTALSSTTVQNPIANPVTTTQYFVTATLGRCSANDTIIVNVNVAPIPDAGLDGDICYGQTFLLRGSGGIQFQWTPAMYLNSVLLQNPTSTPNQTITYSLSVVDANGCPSLIQDQVIVKVTPPIIVRTYPKDTIVYAGDQFQLLATSIGTNYNWLPPLGLNNPNTPNPVLTVSTDILFTVVASTSAGCKGESTVNIKVYKGPDIYVPSGFTPNNDGKNDKLIPFPVGIKELKYFRVYNRWGQLVYSTKTLNEGWDGRIKGVDQPSSSTFVWMVQGVTKDDKIITKTGTVILIR